MDVAWVAWQYQQSAYGQCLQPVGVSAVPGGQVGGGLGLGEGDGLGDGLGLGLGLGFGLGFGDGFGRGLGLAADGTHVPAISMTG
jgi:hypothetical protein